MSTRPTFLQTLTVEIDQDRYEELIRHELLYEQYKQNVDEEIRTIIEPNMDLEFKKLESEEN